MNEQLMTDAISHIDLDLIEDYVKQKERFTKKRERKAFTAYIKCAAGLAACFLLIMIAIPTIMNLQGYNSADETYTPNSKMYFDSYESVLAVVGDEHLLSNLPLSEMKITELRLEHAEDNIADYSALILGTVSESEYFQVGLYFDLTFVSSADSENNKGGNIVPAPEVCDGTDTVMIGETKVEYLDKSESSEHVYEYVAEFEYDGCKYIIHSYGDTSADFFWETLAELLGE